MKTTMSTRTFSLTAAASLALAALALGEDPVGSRIAGYQLKSRSTYSAAEDVRPPFWPIGFVKKTKEQAAVVQFQLDPKMFVVSSILIGQPSLAVINGRAYGEGETLRAPRKEKKGAEAPATEKAVPMPAGVRIRVARIFDGKVTLAAEDQAITLALRRPELTQRAPGETEELLSSDEP